MKSVRVWAEQIANDGVDSGSGPGGDNKIDEIKLTQDGFPIIPNSNTLHSPRCSASVRGDSTSKFANITPSKQIPRGIDIFIDNYTHSTTI